jgi:hypothetical protein
MAICDDQSRETTDSEELMVKKGLKHIGLALRYDETIAVDYSLQ